MNLSRTVPLFFLALGLVPLPASAQVYKCVDANGKITYTNDRPASGKGCQSVSGEQAVSTISMRPPPSSASSFPKVNSDAQRDMDKARRQVLENELDSEQSALEDARKKLAEQEAVRYGDEKNYQKVLDRLQPFKDDVARRERNIEALNSELSRLR